MAASLFQQLYTVVDAAIVGNFVGSVALGAIDSTNSIVRLLVNFFVGISSGASIVVAQLWGARKDREVGSAVYASFLFSVACGALVMVLGLALCYAFGTAWFMIVYARTSGPIGLGAALSMCVAPFLLPDCAKIALALFVSVRLKPLLAKK